MAEIAHKLTDLPIRMIKTVVEEVHTEGGKTTIPPRRVAASYVVIKNPWLNFDTSSNLTEYAAYAGPIISREISNRLLNTLNGAENVAAFGKASVVGLGGEVEHGGALIHTPYFGNILREMLEGSSIICFSESRSEPSTSLRIPLWHKNEAATRDYYQSIEIHLSDAPHQDEIVVMGLAATGPRPHPRIGDRATDPAVSLSIFEGIHA